MENKDRKVYIIVYAVCAAFILALHYALDLKFLVEKINYVSFLKKFSLSIFFIFIILLIGKIIEQLISKHSQTEGDRYNLYRITRLITIILILIIAASFLFQNLYAAAVSFGLISLVMGFALQAPITSFISWLYIVFRRPYQVGHRIQINGMRGDVIEISYLDTTILECSGDYLGNDRLSGRVIHFPNSLILKEEVINYSGPQVPFIWNETAIQIAYTSNIKFVEECLMEAALEDFHNLYPNYNLQKRPEWIPQVYFRVNAYAWLEAVISYPVEPTDTTGRRNRILKEAVPKLNKAPDKVQFPEGTLR